MKEYIIYGLIGIIIFCVIRLIIDFGIKPIFKNKPKVLFECDRNNKRCKTIYGYCDESCRFTTDIKSAVNFYLDEQTGNYIEKPRRYNEQK